MQTAQEVFNTLIVPDSREPQYRAVYDLIGGVIASDEFSATAAEGVGLVVSTLETTLAIVVSLRRTFQRALASTDVERELAELDDEITRRLGEGEPILDWGVELHAKIRKLHTKVRGLPADDLDRVAPQFMAVAKRLLTEVFGLSESAVDQLLLEKGARLV